MKCKNCATIGCPYRTSDAEKECEYTKELGHETLTFEEMKELEAMYLYHDWEKVRIQAAIAAMQGVMNFFGSLDYNIETIAEQAVKQADALVEELKKKGNP